MVAVEEYQKHNFDKRNYAYENKAFGLSHMGLERILRTVYFEFVANDPWYVVQVIVYYNGKSVWRQVGILLLDIWSALGWQFFSVATFAAVVFVAEIRNRKEILREVGLCVGLLIGFAVASAGPNWALLPVSDSMGDPGLMGTLAATVAVFYLIVACAVWADRRVFSVSSRSTLERRRLP